MGLRAESVALCQVWVLSNAKPALALSLAWDFRVRNIVQRVGVEVPCYASRILVSIRSSSGVIILHALKRIRR